ncbi:hypothetical protein EHS25_005971 [Saitozyma podzolica]|uniref:C2 domain-containing protein n=1 Tax=Saitozyma podzolica TaxID=1890683 RepID=A0A427XU44_9TREE|nr:hypothetical protein EHS25_005971 [Saitozyma podzolica]
MSLSQSQGAEPKELGTLIVVVGKARNLPNKSRFSKQDPFCTVIIGEDKQKTKAIKRGGQHPEWDEELRFTILEDADDILTRSDSRGNTSLSSSTSQPSVSVSSLSSSTATKDTPPAPGVITAGALASKSRKGPIHKKGGKSMKVACYADDAKEPELIGEVVVPIEEALKKGEVDEWYEFSYKDKYSGEIYLELTFYSNDIPPVKRNVPRPPIHNYGGAGVFDPNPNGAASSKNQPPPVGLTASGSITGMSLYIPPYAQPARAPSPSPSHLPPSSSFSELGLPPGHNRTNSYPPPVAGQPSYPPSSVASFASNSSTSTITPQHLQSAVDALARPMSSMSLGPTFSSRPLPSATPVPPDHSSSLHAYAAHRHSVGGQADAPWATLLPQSQLPPAPTPHPRPSSTNDMASWEYQQRLEALRHDAPTPIIQPGLGQYGNAPPQQSYTPFESYPQDHRAPSPVPSSLLPGPPRPHAHSFSGATGTPTSSHYLQPSPGPTPPPQPNSAPPDAQASGHYQVPASSFPTLTQPMHEPQRAHSPGPGYQPPSAFAQHAPYANGVGYTSSTPQPEHAAQRYQAHTSYGNTPARSNSYPPRQGHGEHHPYGHDPAYQPTNPSLPPQNMPSAAPQASLPQSHGYQGPSAGAGTDPSNHGGIVPWYLQTQPKAQPLPQTPPQPLLPPASQYPYQAQHPQQSQQGPPAVPEYRPIPNPPAPPKHSVGYYPSDELYAEQRRLSQPSQPIPPLSQWQQQAPAPASSSFVPPQSSYDQQSQQPSPYPPPVSAFSPPPPPPRQPSPAPYRPHLDTTPSSHSPGSFQSTIPSAQPYRAPSPSPTPNLAYNPPYQSHQDPSRPPRASSPLPPIPPQSQSYMSQAPGEWQSQSSQHNTPSHSLAPPQPPLRPISSNDSGTGTGRSPSPTPSASVPATKEGWKSYMQGLGSTLPARSPSPQPEPPAKEWWTPPPSLPASIRPPEGWKSTLPAQTTDGHQWRGQ